MYKINPTIIKFIKKYMQSFLKSYNYKKPKKNISQLYE